MSVSFPDAETIIGGADWPVKVAGLSWLDSLDGANAGRMTQPQWADPEAGRFHPQTDALARATRALRCTICIAPRGTIRLTAAPRAPRAGARKPSPK